MSEPGKLLRTIFGHAVELADAGQRADYLALVCRDNEALRAQVEVLIAAHHAAGKFLGPAGDTFPSGAATGQSSSNAGEPQEKIGPDNYFVADTVRVHSTGQPGDHIGRYKLLQKIGEGGMGNVWMAEQEEPIRRKVALKVIKLGMDTKSVIARFEAERQALALMDHAHIAKVFDAGATETGRPYFVMELVRGVRITDYCDQNNLPTRARLDLFTQVCQAIQHAHQKGIIHRDIKPSNILVTLHDGVPVPKVIDFGIAKATSDQRLTDKTLFTAFEQFMGTPAYMSPEQAEISGLDIDTRSDIYALGVLLYELLTGKPPFDGRELMASGLDAMRRTIREQEPARPSTRLSTMLASDLTTVAKHRQCDSAKLTSAIRGDLDWIVMKALEKDRTRRYDTATGLAQDIQRHLDNEPVIACPPTATYRLSKLVRKHRAAVSVTAAFLFLLASATGVSIWLAVSASRERANALRAEGFAKQARREAEQETVSANRERAKALRAERAAKETLAELQIQRADDFFAADDSSRALIHLARVLTSDPSNRVAAERLLSALTFRTFGLPLTEPLRHEGAVSSAEFSPDGRRVVTASSDSTARVWDAQTGKPLTEPLRHKAAVWMAQFSPDGLRVVTASEDGTARVWDAQTGKPVTDVLSHKTGVRSIQFSPDGLRVVTASYDMSARVWDAQSGQPLIESIRHDNLVQSAQFSPDGLRVVTASFDMTARVWDAQTGKPLTEPLRHEAWVHSAQFSADGLRVVTTSQDKTARVWDAQTGKPLFKLLRHDDSVGSAQFSPDGQRVLTASFDKTARVWDARTGKPLTQPLRHEDMVLSAQFSPDGLRVITASWDKTARVWDAQTGKPLTEPLRHDEAVGFAQFSPDGLRAVTASHDKTARVWDVQSGQPLSEPLRYDDSVGFAQLSPDGLRVATISADKSARVWDARTGTPLTKPLQHEEQVRSAQFSLDGLRLVTASADKTVRLWDATTGRPLTEPLRHEKPVLSAQFSPDGLRVAIISADKSARVWDARTGKPLTPPLRHEDLVQSAQFSADGLRVVTASKDKTARVWDAQTGQPLTGSLRHEELVHSAQFSPDGLRVVTASYDKTALVWDAQTGQPLTAPLRHEDLVQSAQFSPDGLRVVTASVDKTARVWDARTGQPLTEPLRHQDAVLLAQFSPDGLRVVTTSADEMARVWDAKTGQPLSELLHSVRSAQFTSDGLRVVTASAGKKARVWEMTFGSGPAPAWLPQLAIIVAGMRLTGTPVLEAASTEEFLKLKERLMVTPATNYYARWGQWFCADRATRTISPLSRITVPEYVHERLEEDTLESLREAVRLSPTNGLAFARLARKLFPKDPVLNPREAAEAQGFSQRALRLAPNDAEVLRIRAEIAQQSRLLTPP